MRGMRTSIDQTLRDELVSRLQSAMRRLDDRDGEGPSIADLNAAYGNIAIVSEALRLMPTHNPKETK